MPEEDNYLEIIPEDYRDVPSIKEAGSLDALLQQHVNLEKKMGTAVFAPGEEADEEQWNSFYGKVNDLAPGLTRIPTSEEDKGWDTLYNKLGRPEEASGYEMPEIKIGEGDEVLDQSDYAEPFKEVSHQLGLSNRQFNGLMKWIGGRTAERLEASAGKRDEVMNELQKEWGDGMDARVSRVKAVIEKFGGEGAGEAMGDLGNNPVVLKMLDKMADSIEGESSLDDDTAVGGAERRSEIEAEIATLKGNKAYMDKKNPDHDRVVKRVNSLYERLESYKAA